MGTLVRVQHKGQMTIPSTVRAAVGLVEGDMVDVRAIGNKIVITPQLVIDRSKFPPPLANTHPRSAAPSMRTLPSPKRARIPVHSRVALKSPPL